EEQGNKVLIQTDNLEVIEAI
ncbi:hypothetical protein Golob_026615, partial [Gossypium lobatum]|nr:hypothetical protein [Gossypium lobatum]